MILNENLSHIFGSAILMAIVLIGCTPVSAPMQASTHTPAPPCPASYPGKWREVLEWQAIEVINSTLLDEIITAVKELYPEERCYPPVVCDIDSCPSGCRDVEIYMLQHPDDPTDVFVVYKKIAYHHSLVNTILLRRTNGEWSELPQPPYYRTHMMDVDLIGFVWECDAWSLYAQAHNTDYLITCGKPCDSGFFQSRDNGRSWSSFANCFACPAPPLSPPSDAKLAMEFCYEAEGELTHFAWVGDTLYAFTHPFTSINSSSPCRSPY